MGSHVSTLKDLVLLNDNETQGKGEEEISDEEVMHLAAETNIEPKTIRFWYKQFRKDFPSGKLSKAKFDVYYCETFPGINPQEFSTRLFEHFDKDRDGYLDFREFLLAVRIRLTTEKADKLHLSYDFFDTKKDGKFTKEQFQDMLNIVHRAGSGRTNFSAEKILEVANDIYAELDDNGDGFVTEEEYISALQSNVKLNRILKGI